MLGKEMQVGKQMPNKDRVTDQMNLGASVSSSIQVHTWKCLHASSVSKRFVIHH